MLQSLRWSLGLAVLVSLPTGASAQTWSGRAAVGLVYFRSADVALDAQTIGDWRAGLALSVDVRRDLAPGLSGSVGFLSIGMPMRVNSTSGVIADVQLRPSALTLGVAYEIPIGRALSAYAGVLAAGLSRESMTVPAVSGGVTVTYAGGWGVGAEFGARWPGCGSCAGVSLDARVTWLQIKLPDSNGAYPLLVSLGVTKHF